MPTEPDPLATLPAFLHARAAAHAARDLLARDDGRLGYAEAESRSARLARGLLGRGVGKGTRVGLLAPNGAEWVLGWLAAARIGALVVPINTFYKTRELAWTLRHADVDTLLAVPRFLSQDYLARMEEAAPGLTSHAGGPLRLPELPYLRSVLVWGGSDRAWAGDADALEAAAGEDAGITPELLAAVESEVTAADALTVLYSSGSTADPKGAVHTHGAVLRQAHRLRALRGLTPEDRVWSPMPFFWVGGFVFALLCTLDAGACMVCEDTFDPERTLALLERERATVAIGWPHFGKALAEHPSRAQRDLGALRAGNVPGILPPEVAPPDPELRANALGMTETCGPHTWSGEGALPDALRGSFGRALGAVEHRVVDPDTGAVLAPGKTGEICVRGDSLMQGLYKREREATFTTDGFYRTGDAGWFDADGVLYFEGRLGDMIKSGGANVTPAEVEQVLVAQPEVKDAYVVGVPHPERGQQVAAAVVLEAGASLAAGALRERARSSLAAYKAPRHVFLMDAAELPFTDSGKIDKRRLEKLLSERLRG